SRRPLVREPGLRARATPRNAMSRRDDRGSGADLVPRGRARDCTEQEPGSAVSRRDPAQSAGTDRRAQRGGRSNIRTLDRRTARINEEHPPRAERLITPEGKIE